MGGGGWRNSSDKKERDTKSSVMLSWRVGRGFCPSHLWRTVTPLTDLCRKTWNASFASPAFLLIRRPLFFLAYFVPSAFLMTLIPLIGITNSTTHRPIHTPRSLFTHVYAHCALFTIRNGQTYVFSLSLSLSLILFLLCNAVRFFFLFAIVIGEIIRKCKLSLDILQLNVSLLASTLQPEMTAGWWLPYLWTRKRQFIIIIIIILLYY